MEAVKRPVAWAMLLKCRSQTAIQNSSRGIKMVA
jgi:hypothetical protein